MPFSTDMLMYFLPVLLYKRIFLSSLIMQRDLCLFCWGSLCVWWPLFSFDLLLNALATVCCLLPVGRAWIILKVGVQGILIRCLKHLNWLCFSAEEQWFYTKLPMDNRASHLISRAELHHPAGSSFHPLPPGILFF